LAYHTIFNKLEITQLAAEYGQPIHRDLTIDADKYLFSSRQARSNSKRGEVVMLIDRPNGSLLLHRKGWYERGVYRLPTGGIEWGEEIDETLHRELEEETGYYAGSQKFLGILDCHFVFKTSQTRFISYLFYLWDLSGTLRLPTSNEDISDFRDIPKIDLPQVAENLRHVPPPRTGWGKWRSLAHDFAFELLVTDHEGTNKFE
jgi:ADP-ribose pyrophosphatase YjhB (NUDIX family)